MAQKGIKLGDEIEDVTSKTVGIAIARTEYLSGSVYWTIQPYTTDDNIPLKTYDVHDAYCVYKGPGVYPPAKKQPMGFHARNEQ